MFKVIIFDLGGVLIDNPQSKMFAYYANTLGVSKEKFENIFKKHKDLWQKGLISEKEFWNKMTNDLGINSKLESFSLWLEGFKKAFKERKIMFSLVKKLENKNYNTAILSNTEVPVMNFIKAKKYKNFDFFIFSCKIGMVKPDREIYEYIIKKLRARSEEIIFIDDKKENVIGAKEVGIKGIEFKNFNKLKRELGNLGII